MTKYFSFAALLVYLTFTACAGGAQGNKQNLSAQEFYDKITQTKDGSIIDVRTLEEFNGGHLERAANIDWNSNGFEKKMEGFDKDKPAFVYCLSGGRSSSAAAKMRSMGFKEVYELNGGMMKWRAAGLPEAGANASAENKGMSIDEFNKYQNTDKLVLVDFYAEWCAPCKKMKPYLEEIERDMKDKVQIIRIDADKNTDLVKALKIDALPVLLLYKNQKLEWRNQGYITKAEVVEKLNVN